MASRVGAGFWERRVGHLRCEPLRATEPPAAVAPAVPPRAMTSGSPDWSRCRLQHSDWPAAGRRRGQRCAAALKWLQSSQEAASRGGEAAAQYRPDAKTLYPRAPKPNRECAALRQHGVKLILCPRRGHFRPWDGPKRTPEGAQPSPSDPWRQGPGVSARSQLLPPWRGRNAPRLITAAPLRTFE